MSVAAEPTTRGETGLIAVDSVPATWRPSTIRQLTRPVSRKGFPDLPVLSVYRDYGVILKDSRDDNHNATGEDLTQYKAVYPGDLVLNKMKTWQGSLGVSDHEGLVSPAYITCETTPDENRRFLHYLLRSTPYIHEYHRISFGVRVGQWDMRYEDFREIPVYLPPRPEQDAIVAYLDGKLEAIDRYLRVKEREIALLEERKRALIHRAVTRGLDPNPELQPSGISWLPEIPVGWEISRLKFVASRIADCLHATPTYDPDGEFPAIRTADIVPGTTDPQGARKVSESEYRRWTTRLTPHHGDILYSREGERYGIAAPVPPGVDLCISQRMMVFRIGCEAESDYLMWQLNCPHVYQQAAQDTIGATSPHVNVETIKNFTLVLPDRQEQRAIAKFIRSEADQIDTTITRARRQIERMQEYRTALIAEAVTGKIDAHT